MNQYLAAYEKHRDAAHTAYHAFVDLCGGTPPPRVPGMSTDIRLAWRLERGYTIEQAAAKEYVYRWRLAIRPPDQCIGSDRPAWNEACSVFGTPHTIGL